MGKSALKKGCLQNVSLKGLSMEVIDATPCVIYDKNLFESYDIIDNDPLYVGYKFTFTFNHKIWSLVQSWTECLDKVKSQLNSFYDRVSGKFMVITVESHTNNYAHVHGLLYFPKESGFDKLLLDTYMKKWKHMFGITQFVKLDTRKQLEAMALLVPSIQIKCWLTYILKDIDKYRDYMVVRQN